MTSVDRTVTKAYEIGLKLHRDDTEAPAYEAIVGDTLGRTPVLGEALLPALAVDKLQPLIEANLQV